MDVRIKPRDVSRENNLIKLLQAPITRRLSIEFCETGHRERTFSEPQSSGLAFLVRAIPTANRTTANRAILKSTQAVSRI